VGTDFCGWQNGYSNVIIAEPHLSVFFRIEKINTLGNKALLLALEIPMWAMVGFHYRRTRPTNRHS
jgi:hypothetical protein